MHTYIQARSTHSTVESISDLLRFDQFLLFPAVARDQLLMELSLLMLVVLIYSDLVIVRGCPESHSTTNSLQSRGNNGSSTFHTFSTTIFVPLAFGCMPSP